MHNLLLAACCLVSGLIRASSGSPIAAAHVLVHGHASVSATSDASGAFSLQLVPGDYRMDVVARGFGAVTIDLRLDHDVRTDVTLEPLDAATLRTIGTVSVDGRLAPVQGTIPSVELSRKDLERIGANRVIEGLAAIPSVTFAHPGGGQSGAIATVALRGPDPSETLVALDGQLLNDGNTGDVDLSQFPIDAFSSINVTEGLGSQDNEASNTIGGELNLTSLRPTRASHFGFGESAGSFGMSDFWANQTGTHGKLGYAFAADEFHQAGYVNEYQMLNGTTPTHLGSWIASRSALANITYAFSQNADITARVFTMGNARDESSAINGIQGNPTRPNFGEFIGPGEQVFAQNIRAYQLRARAPLGSGEVIAEASADNDAVDINGAANNPMYDVTHRDRRTNAALSWERTFGESDYAVGGYARHETLDFVDPSGGYPGLAQSITNLFARGSVQATKELRLSGGVYASHYSTFGSNFDWRAGATMNTSPDTAYRFSVGTGFRAPLLIERYIFPISQLAPDAYGVYTGQGNANEQPEHATEYELGVSHRFSADTNLDASLYRTNLRDPIENYYPYAFATAGGCAANLNNPPPAVPDQRCFSYPINIGNVVYEGAELHFGQRFPREHLFLSAMYGINVAYPQNFGTTISNPTSGGNLVNNQQFLGIPQQQGSLELDWAQNDWHVSGLATFVGNNNSLDQAAYARVDLAAGTKINPLMDVTLVGTNLFNAGSGRYTLYGAGIPYRGIVGPGPNDFGNIPTDKFVTEPFGLKVVITLRT